MRRQNARPSLWRRLLSWERSEPAPKKPKRRQGAPRRASATSADSTAPRTASKPGPPAPGGWRTLFGGNPTNRRRRGARKQAAASSTSPTSSTSPKTTPKPSADRGVMGLVMMVLGWLVPLAVAVGAFATPLVGAQAVHYLKGAGHFQVKEVLIEGHVRLTEQRVAEIAGVDQGAHVLGSDLDAIVQRLQAHDWVARAAVTRELPDRLRIRLVEHIPHAYLALDRLWLVDATGEPFAPVGPHDDLDLPMLTGLTPTHFADPVSKDMARADIRAALNLARLYQAMGLADRFPLAEIRLAPARRAHLVLSEIGTDVALGTPPYREKLYRLEWVLESLHEAGKVAEYVLLDGMGRGVAGAAARWDGSDGRVVVKADLAPTQAEVAAAARDRAERAAALAPQGGEQDPDAQIVPGQVLGPLPLFELPPSGPSGGGLPPMPGPVSDPSQGSEAQNPHPVAGGVRPAALLPDPFGAAESPDPPAAPSGAAHDPRP